MEFAKRKPLRLKDYDYAQNGAYFVTVCTYEHKCLLGKICSASLEPQIQLSDYGLVVLKHIRKIPGIGKFVIMPNHIHMIIEICDVPAGARHPDLSSRIRSFKGLVTKEIGELIWQRSFYDRIIRDENEFLEIWKYIDGNPSKWLTDEYYN